MTTILVGVDGSPEAAAALHWALVEASRQHAAVSAVCAWQSTPYGLYAPGAMIPPLDLEGAERDAEEQLADTTKRVREAVPSADGVEVTTRVRMGPAPLVLAEASRQVDLVVVGSRLIGPAQRAVLGSTSSAVLHHAHCPVVVVPGTPAAAAGSGRVVVGVAANPASTAALAWGAAAAARRGVRLEVVHVRPPLSQANGRLSMPETEVSERGWLAAELATAGLGDNMEAEVRIGRPGEELARDLVADDLLVLGSRGRGALLGWLLGSTSTYAIHHSRCAVAVVREPAEAV